MWQMCAVLSTVLAISEAVRLSPCGNAGYQDVVENTNITFTCDQYTGSVTWGYKGSDSYTPAGPQTITTCDETHCGQSIFPSLWTVSWISSSSSKLTISWTDRTLGSSGAKYLCDTEQCGLHVIMPAVVSQPTTPDIRRQDSGYTVYISAAITKVYSSRRLYSCVWQLGSVSQITTPDLAPPTSDTNNTADRSGSCDVTMPLLSNTGDYSCSVTVNPGNTQKSYGTISTTRPSPPTITCPSDVITENTSLTCTCDTTNIGQPGGRLRWFTGTGNDVTTEVTSGGYDVSSVSMTWRVSRADHNVRKFRCVNNWTVNITAENDYTAQVAYLPTEPTLKVNDDVTVTVNENEAVTLVCESRGHPSPDLELLQRGTLLARQVGGSVTEEMSQLSHTDTARCNNTGTVTCRAENEVGDVQSSSVTLHVNCKPREVSPVSEIPSATIITATKPVTLSFLLEAFPLPHNFTFHYLGSNQNSTSKDFNSQNSSNLLPVPASVKLDATCTNTFADYAVRCDVIVSSVTDPSVEGLYSFTVANTFGEERMVFLVTRGSVTEEGTYTPSSLILGAAVGGGVAVLIIVIIVVVVFFIRRKKKKDTHRKRNDRKLRSQVGQSAVAHNPASPSPYEDIEMDKNSFPVVSPHAQDNAQAGPPSGPPAAVDSNTADAGSGSGPSGADENAYAPVRKVKKSSVPLRGASAASPSPAAPAAAADKTGEEDSMAYAVVDKNKKKNGAGAQQGQSRVTGMAAGPKTPPASIQEESVYKNQSALQGEAKPAAASAAATAPRTPVIGSGGLNYTAVYFTDAQKEMAKQPAPRRNRTDYTEVDIRKTAEAAKRKTKNNDTTTTNKKK